MVETTERPFITTTELAQRLGIAVESLRARMKRDPERFPTPIRPGGFKMMFDPDDIDAWIDDLKAKERERIAADRAHRERVRDAIGH